MNASLINLTLPDALKQYQDLYLAGRNLAPLTRVAYSIDLRELLAFLRDECDIRVIQQVERGHLDRYLAGLDGAYAPRSRRRKVASIRSFFAFWEDQGAFQQSPAKKLIPPMDEVRQPLVLTEAEYKRLREAAQYEPRDLAIIEVLLQTGMRLNELAKLTLNDIDLPAGRITKDDLGSVTIHGKGRKTRSVTLNWKACRAIKSYLAQRPADTGSPSLFLTKFRRGIGPRSIENVVTKYLTEANISGASVHTLRHTMATHMVKKGTKLDVVRKVLGHTSLKTTGIYIDLARDVMDEEMQRNAL